MRIKILVLMMVLVLCGAVQAGIYSPEGVVGEDTLCISFVLYDSLGNVTPFEANDSVFVMTFYPRGACAFRDSMVYTDAQIDDATGTWEDWAGGGFYTYHIDIANADGTTQEGTYRYVLVAQDNDLGLHSTFMGEFQVTDSSFNSAVIKAARDSGFVKGLTSTKLGYIDQAISDEVYINWDDSADYHSSQLFAMDCARDDSLFMDSTTLVGRVQAEAEDAIDAKFSFTGTDVDATLDGETVVLAPSGLDGDTSFTQVQNAIDGLNDIDGTAVKLAADGLDADTSFTQLQTLAGTNLDTTMSSRGTSDLTEALVESNCDDALQAQGYTSTRAGYLDLLNTNLDEAISGIDDNPWDAVTRTLTTADWTTDADLAGLNDVSAAEVNTQVDNAIETYHLDHLLAVEYDPASKPGVATALFNELVESDAGVSRYTTNALEQAPSGGSGSDTTAIRIMMQKERIARLSDADTTLRLQVNSSGDVEVNWDDSSDYHGSQMFAMDCARDDSLFMDSATILAQIDTVIWGDTADTPGERERKLIDSGSGSDTSSIKTMLINNLFCRVDVDTPITLNPAGFIIVDDTVRTGGEIPVLADLITLDTSASGIPKVDVREMYGDSASAGGLKTMYADTAITTSISNAEMGAIADSTLNVLLDGSNEDNFKATSVTVSDKTGFELADGAITSAKIAANAIDSTKVNDNLAVENGTGVWATSARALTTFDEDYTSIDIDGTTLGTVTDVTNPDTAGLARTADTADYKATGYAVAGDAMALTPAERGHLEDSVHAQAADYQGAGSDTAAIHHLMETTLDVARDADKADYKATGFSTFDPSTTSVVADDTTSAGDNIAIDADSAIYQGSAASISESSIYTYFIDGSREDQFKDLTAGTGAYPCSLYVLSAADSATAVQGVTVRAMNDAQSATSGIDQTDGNGLVVLSLDAAQYKVWCYKAGVTAPTPDSVTVISPALTDTILVTVFSPSAPVSANLCSVYGHVYDIRDSAVEGAIVRMRLTTYNVRRIADSVIVSYAEIVDTTDATGKFEIGLYPNVDLSPSGTKYRISVETDANIGIVRYRDFTVPDQTTWRLIW